MNIGEMLLALKAKKKTGFIPYITAGDPSLESTRKHVHALVAAGAAAVELGVPFSDPVADGPVNQRAAERALKNGVTLTQVLGLAKQLRGEGIQVPLILFTYFNPIHRMGIELFARSAREHGITGVLCVDLPPEEAEEYKLTLSAQLIETIFLASPMTSPSRLPLVERFSTSTVYYVSRTGVTGEHAELSTTLEAELTRARKSLKKALIVGFGISTPAQAKAVARHADGVVIGSAIVKLIEDGGDVGAFAKSIVAALG